MLATGLPVLADDSGISVDGLDGAPGVYTADWAETPNGRDFLHAMTRTWNELDARGVAEPRTAQFPLDPDPDVARRARGKSSRAWRRAIWSGRRGAGRSRLRPDLRPRWP